MARHGFRLGPTPCRSHASAMPIGVGRHHQTNQSQTKDLTERIADALVSAMCPPAFLEKQKENASSIGTALYFVLVGPTKENASSIGTALYYALVGPTKENASSIGSEVL